MVDTAREQDPAVPPADRGLLLSFVGAARELVATHLLTQDARSLPDLENTIVTVAERLLLNHR
jgi:hypothetical protein